MRKLVTVRTIGELSPIPGADAIEVATIDGWKVVTKKGEFTSGDACVYFEIDSFLPESDERYAFLMKSGVREFEGVRGHKLRTAKLRGQISQGLALPAANFPEFYGRDMDTEDFAAIIGVKKWEPLIPAAIAGQVKGVFPSFIRKTDQERCQNLVSEIFEANRDARYEVTVKLDGSSCTIYHNNGEVGVCSRNLELKMNEENAGNALVQAFPQHLQEAMKCLGRNLAFQGEIMGPGIQGNRENLKTPKLFIFDIFDIDVGQYLPPADRKDFVDDFQHVPVLYSDVTLAEIGIVDMESLLKFADGPSVHHAVREGVVFKRMDGQFSFKAISNAFLAKEKD